VGCLLVVEGGWGGGARGWRQGRDGKEERGEL